MLVRIIIKNMLSWKGFDVIEKMLDRWIGKPKQEIDNNITAIPELSKEQKGDLVEMLKLNNL
jgi:hypothetical protein